MGEISEFGGLGRPMDFGCRAANWFAVGRDRDSISGYRGNVAVVEVEHFTSVGNNR